MCEMIATSGARKENPMMQYFRVLPRREAAGVTALPEVVIGVATNG